MIQSRSAFCLLRCADWGQRIQMILVAAGRWRPTGDFPKAPEATLIWVEDDKLVDQLVTSQSRVTSQAPTSSRAWLTSLPMPGWHSLWGTENSWCARGPMLSFSENEALTREQRGPGAKGSSSSPLAFSPKAEWLSEPESHWAQPQATAPAG